MKGSVGRSCHPESLKNRLGKTTTSPPHNRLYQPASFKLAVTHVGMRSFVFMLFVFMLSTPRGPAAASALARGLAIKCGQFVRCDQ